MDIAGSLYPTGRIGTTNYILTPENIVNDMINMLPADFWTPDIKVLDIFSKSGRFLMAAYKKLFNSPYLADMDVAKRKRHILSEQLYGITDDFTCLMLSESALYGYAQYGKKNIRMIEDLQSIVKDSDSERFRKAVEENFGKMKFDLVIGNPPYNDTNSTGSSKSVNTYFVKRGASITKRYMAFIMPDRWFVSSDALNSECRRNMIGKIRYMRDFDNADEIFEGTKIAGGVSYFLYDKQYDGEMVYEDNRGQIRVKHTAKFMCKSIQSNLLYNRVKEIAKEYMDADFISTSFFGLTRDAVGNAVKTERSNIRLKSSGNDTFMNINDIPKNKQYAALYKVVIPYSAMNPKPFILMPNEICTLTYLVVRFFDNITEAENCKKYFETDFFKVLFGGLKTKLGSTKENFACIPVQDFTNQSDIDWSQSVADVNKQLYEKYNLTAEEINIIEKSVNEQR